MTIASPWHRGSLWPVTPPGIHLYKNPAISSIAFIFGTLSLQSGGFYFRLSK